MALFTTSLVIYGFRFEENANKHRECHLKLQALLSRKDTTDDIQKEYNEILSLFPNHAPIDYIRLIMKQTCFQNKKIWDTENQDIKADWKTIVQYFWHYLRFRFCMYALIFIPLILLSYSIWSPLLK